MDKLLDDEITGQIKQIFRRLKERFQILLFASKAQCDLCNETRALLDEVVALDA